MEGTLFGLTEERIAELGMTWGVGGFIALMLFIIWKLAIVFNRKFNKIAPKDDKILIEILKVD